MEIKVIGQATDYRSNTPVIYAQMPVRDYLGLINENFDDFRFQRKRTMYSPYLRMKEDIKQGALLPTITLAIKSEYTKEILTVLDDYSKLENVLLNQSGKINILDGLQRTYILKDLEGEGFQFIHDQKVFLEIWVESEIKHLIYRLIVLNAGQKKMSMRHQIEMLFLNIKDSIEIDIPDLIIHTQKESTRRTQSKKFSLDRLAMGYQSFLLKNTEVKRSNVVAQEMLENNILESTAEQLGQGFEDFKKFLKIYARLDESTFQHYGNYTKDEIEYELYNDIGNEDETILKNSKHWFAGENVINCFFAAVSKFLNVPDREDTLIKTLEHLNDFIITAEVYSDPLGLAVLYKLQEGINPRKMSIDFQTRKIMFNGFQEYFKEDGKTPLSECWKLGAE